MPVQIVFGRAIKFLHGQRCLIQELCGRFMRLVKPHFPLFGDINSSPSNPIGISHDCDFIEISGAAHVRTSVDIFGRRKLIGISHDGDFIKISGAAHVRMIADIFPDENSSSFELCSISIGSMRGTLFD